MSSPPPATDCSSSHCLRARGARLRSKVAETSARSAPWRTASAPARAPASSCNASTMIDLPAPVSPVSTVSPGRSSSSTESMMAKSRICRCVSMVFLALEAAAAPVELGAQHLVVVVTLRMQERHALGGEAHLEPVLWFEGPEDDAVAGDV